MKKERKSFGGLYIEVIDNENLLNNLGKKPQKHTMLGHYDIEILTWK